MMRRDVYPMRIFRKDISKIDEKQCKDINQFVEENNGLIFHETKFNEIVSGSFNTSLSYLLAYVNNKLAGICPMHTIKNGILKLTYSNPAIFEVPYGGWVFDNKQVSIQHLLNQTNPALNEHLTYWSNIQIKEDSNEYDNLNFSYHKTAVIDLSPDEDTIWKGVINSKRRNMIRKALKSGVKIRSYDAEGFKSYYPLMTDMHDKANLETKPVSYYENVMHNYFAKKQAAIFLAEINSEVMSGVILIGNKYIMHYWQGASRRVAPNLGQNELLQWEAIKWAKHNGGKYYDLCVVEQERLPHIARFKLGFSKNIVPFYHISKKPLGFRVLSKLQKTYNCIARKINSYNLNI